MYNDEARDELVIELENGVSYEDQKESTSSVKRKLIHTLKLRLIIRF